MSSKREELEGVLTQMLENLQASTTLKQRIGQGDTSVRFTISDLGTRFTLRFAKGQVAGGTGDEAPCPLGVVLASQVLDDLLTGKRDPMSAYTMGTLTLRGSEYLAEEWLRYLPDISAAYTAAVHSARA